MSDLITVPEAANLVDRGITTIHRWIREGYLHAEKAVYPERVGMRGRNTGYVVDANEVIAVAKTRNKHRGPGSVIPPEDHAKLAYEFETTDVTYAELGRRYGVSRQRIQQILVKDFEWAIKRRNTQQGKRRKERLERELNRRLNTQMDIALAENRKCVTCGAWVIRPTTGEHMTCSTECADAWGTLRTFDNYEGHRRHVSQYAMSHPDQVTEAQLELARQVVDGTAPPPNRRFFVPGSQRAELIRKYRPKAFREIVLQAGPGTKTWKAYSHVLSDEEKLRALQDAEEDQVSN